MVLKELESKRVRLKELEACAAGRDDELEGLNQKLEGHEELVRTLKADAEDASRLRREVHGKDLELERLASELDSKKELISALRKDAERADRLESEANARDEDIEKLRFEKEESDRRVAELTEDLESLQESAEDQNMQESMELQAVRAELDARKTLIDSLRADAARLGALEASLEEKRQVIGKLEDSMNRQAGTITELKNSISHWQNRYAALRTKQGPADSNSVDLPVLSDADLRAIEKLESATPAEKTIAIDMRESLLEARRSSPGKK